MLIVYCRLKILCYFEIVCMIKYNFVFVNVLEGINVFIV